MPTSTAHARSSGSRSGSGRGNPKRSSPRTATLKATTRCSPTRRRPDDEPCRPVAADAAALPRKRDLMEIGYFLSSEDNSPKELIEQAKLAEGAGFGEVMI